MYDLEYKNSLNVDENSNYDEVAFWWIKNMPIIVSCMTE